MQAGSNWSCSEEDLFLNDFLNNKFYQNTNAGMLAYLKAKMLFYLHLFVDSAPATKWSHVLTIVSLAMTSIF